MDRRTLLIELGTEELPSASLQPLGAALLESLLSQLGHSGVTHGQGRWFATPRRLAVLIEEVGAEQPDSSVEKLGPAVAAAFGADGAPTPAAIGFARGCGVDVSALSRVQTDKGERLAFHQTLPGQSTTTLIPGFFQNALAALPIAKRMRWGARRAEFVRPAQWLVMLFGKELVSTNIFGIESGRLTRGHRIHGEQSFELTDADGYEQALQTRGWVIADFARRRQLIEEQVRDQAAIIGGHAIVDDGLLDEVTSLVEWPRALTGRFDPGFLDIPPEALISSMKKHQKYFHVVDTDGRLMAHFITIANLESRDPAQVIAGNERVIRPRLADAAFFYHKDLQSSLTERRERLRSIVFQNDLGSIWDKTERIAALAAVIGEQIGADATLCRRAGELCKSDLVSEMVLEFDDMQGTAGFYYAQHDGENADVASAMSEHYMPRQAGDALPSSQVGIAVALADRIDTLTGIFGIGQPPTGSRDPFALRRAALGVLRICVEKELDLDLRPLVAAAAGGFPDLKQSDTVVDEVCSYAIERFRAWVVEEGMSAESYLAVQARGITHPLDFYRRVEAVNAFASFNEAAALAAANKRVANILSKQSEDLAGIAVDPSLLHDRAEIELAQAIDAARGAVSPLVASRNYPAALQALASLRDPVDAFFDQVLVNTEEVAVRQNRFALLHALRSLFLDVADISALAVS